LFTSKIRDHVKADSPNRKRIFGLSADEKVSENQKKILKRNVSKTMLNFRKLKQDFAPAILKEGKELYDKTMVASAKILNLDTNRLRLNCRVRGNFDNVYESEIEIDRFESRVLDSNCDCTYNYDCQHLAAFLFYLEDHLDEIVVNFSKEANLEDSQNIDESEKQQLQKAFKEAAKKENLRRDGKAQQELLEEYLFATNLMSHSPFFLPEEEIVEDRAELAIIFGNTAPQNTPEKKKSLEIQLALRLPYRSKPLNVLNIKEFLDSIRYHEPIFLSGKRYFFTPHSFDAESSELLHMIIDHARFPEQQGERYQRTAQLEFEAFGTILAKSYELAKQKPLTGLSAIEGMQQMMPCLYNGSLESPLSLSTAMAQLHFVLEYLEVPSPKILLKPMVAVDESVIIPEDGALFECSKPGFIYNNSYYRFEAHIKRMHLRHLDSIRKMTIPEPLFGTFVENALPELRRYAEVINRDLIERFVTLPFVGSVGARCHIQYVDGELEASLSFIYDNIEIPAAPGSWNYDHTTLFLSDHGVLARNLNEEKRIIQDLFQDFLFDPKQGIYIAKTEKKIVEFMTEIIPQFKDRVEFICPDNLLDQFIYDQTRFIMHFRESSKVNAFEVELKVDGHLKGEDGSPLGVHFPQEKLC
jgi:hypothetical protein